MLLSEGCSVCCVFVCCCCFFSNKYDKIITTSTQLQVNQGTPRQTIYCCRMSRSISLHFNQRPLQKDKLAHSLAVQRNCPSGFSFNFADKRKTPNPDGPMDRYYGLRLLVLASLALWGPTRLWWMSVAGAGEKLRKSFHCTAHQGSKLTQDGKSCTMVPGLGQYDTKSPPSEKLVHHQRRSRSRTVCHRDRY